MTSDEGLRRVLGPFSATSVVVGAIIGVGIFFTPSGVARVAGSESLALLTWGVGGAIALLGALTFAELGGLYPTSGAQYRVLHDAYGPALAFVYVACNLTAIQAGAVAIIALICTSNVAVVLGVELDGLSRSLVSVGLIAMLVAVNVVGVRLGSIVQNVTVLAKLLTLAVIFALAVFFAGSPPGESAAGSPAGGTWWTGLFAGLVPVLFSFGGWQQALWVGGEVRDPKRNVPRAIVRGVLVVVVVYLASNWAYFELLGYGGVANSQALAADAATKVWPGIGRRLVAGAVAFSALGVLNAQFLTGPRLAFAMARDGRFFAAFGRLGRHATPFWAIALLGGLAVGLLLLAGSDGVSRLTNGVVLVDAVFFMLTGLALPILRRRRPRSDRTVSVPLYPWVPLLFVLGEGAVLAGAFMDEQYRDTAFVGVAWIAVAALAYGFLFRTRRTSVESPRGGSGPN